VDALHADFCRWMFDHDQAPPIRTEFLSSLSELDCEMRLIAAEEFVMQITIKADVEVQQRSRSSHCSDNSDLNGRHAHCGSRTRRCRPSPVSSAGMNTCIALRGAVCSRVVGPLSVRSYIT
jgi:hypothetical protein